MPQRPIGNDKANDLANAFDAVCKEHGVTKGPANWITMADGTGTEITFRVFEEKP